MQAEIRHPPGKRGRRLLWFVLMYLASLAVFSALVYGLKLIIPQ